MTLSLDDLLPGQCGYISGYARNSRVLRERLLALGATRGTRVRVVRRALAGCPIEIDVRGSSLMLRRSEAAAIELTLERAR
jgi:ferrous iron transport protein A